MLRTANITRTSQHLVFSITIRHSSTKPRYTRLFTLLSANVDTSTTEYTQNLTSSHAFAAKYKALLSAALAGGGSKAIERHVKYNKKLLAGDRLRLLFDSYESILEVAPLAGTNMNYGNLPRAGILAAVGKIHGVYCVVSANDATVKAGTMYPITVKKQLRLQEIAKQNNLPFIFVVDSGGAFLPLQADIFPGKKHGGRVFYNEAILNSLNIPQLAMVCGSCTAGAAYVPTMVQESIIVHEIGSVFLGGPPLVKAALGEEISTEDLGGATLHCVVSGCTDHFAATEEEAFTIARDAVAAFNIEPVQNAENYDDPIYDPDEILGIIPYKDQHTMDMYKVLARLVDGSRFHEFKRMYGKGLITGFAFLQGNLVGLVADNDITTADSALKGAHFIQLCDQRQIPLIFLQNTTPRLASVSTHVDDNSAKLKAEAKMMSVIACSSVPKITVITGNSIGSYNMCCRSFSPNFLFTWPNAQISMENPDDIVSAVLETTGKNDKDTRKQVTEEVMYKCSSIFMASQLYTDGIILPQDTRKVLGQCLEIINQNRQQKRTKYSVVRM